MRHRSLALVVREGKILMIHTYRFQRYIYELPGGGIETDETPEEAAVRELWEECGLNGTVVRPLNVLHRSNGNTEYVFLVDVSEEQEPTVGYDPEIAEGKEQAIKAVCWKELSELSEKDRAFLWSYGLMDVDGFREVVLEWGDEVSYPGKRRNEIAKLIGIEVPWENLSVSYEIFESVQEDGYTRQLISYASDGDKVSAYLLLPDKLEGNPAVLINHQHNREHHLGKSEVCGLAGNPLQAFGPALAKQGFVVLAPDSVCFEERRVDPTVEGFDFGQHFQEMTYRIVTGEFLMKRVLTDVMNGISLLRNMPFVDGNRIGTMGHSYGGNTTLFLAALDERISFSCASGSACTFEYRMKHGTGIEMASVIPNFHGKYDIDDLVALTAPRKLLIVSSDEDKYSMDASEIVEKAGKAYAEFGVVQNLEHKRYAGGHGMTEERFRDIINWVIKRA